MLELLNKQKWEITKLFTVGLSSNGVGRHHSLTWSWVVT